MHSKDQNLMALKWDITNGIRAMILPSYVEEGLSRSVNYNTFWKWLKGFRRIKREIITKQNILHTNMRVLIIFATIPENQQGLRHNCNELYNLPISFNQVNNVHVNKDPHNRSKAMDDSIIELGIRSSSSINDIYCRCFKQVAAWVDLKEVATKARYEVKSATTRERPRRNEKTLLKHAETIKNDVLKVTSQNGKAKTDN